jgi:TM2 domain-containing membrane protein YozV
MNCAVHSQSEAVAYCRTCGKALCEDCKRDVMGAIYCEPCIAARLQSAGVSGAAMPGAMAPPPQVNVPGAPNPVAAGLLGLIPGVGAMYNGQFAKALAHVVIFVLLIVAANSISGYFGILIGFFVIYMAFEAYKTAEAKRHGLPAPDPLGLDRMFGIQDPPAAAAVPTATAYSPAVYPAVTGSPQQPLQVEPPPPPRDNAPIGAIVLIALGVIFLLDNLGIFRMHHLWPLFLIGIGIWIAYKRTVQSGAGGTR